MKFLCDVHISYKLVNYLRDKDCAAHHINHLFDDPLTKDTAICRYADENDLIVITKDADFKESHILKNTPRKLIKLNTGNSSTQQILFLFEKIGISFLKLQRRKPFSSNRIYLTFFL